MTNLLWANRPLLSNVWNERRCRWESPSAMKNASAPRLTLEAEPEKKEGGPFLKTAPLQIFHKEQNESFQRGGLFCRKPRAFGGD